MMRDIVLRNTFARQYITEPLYEGDGGYRLVLNLRKDVAGAEVKVKVQRSDKTVITYLGETDGVYAYCDIDAGAFKISGEVTIRMQCISSGYAVTTTEACGVVIADLDGESVSGDDRYPILTSLINEVLELKNNVAAFDSEYIKGRYVWYANVNAVAKVSKPLVKIGGIEEFKQANNMFSVIAAASVIGTAIIPDLTASVVKSSVESTGSYSMFHNGDLLLYAGSALGQEVWRWIPQAEAKYDEEEGIALDGVESAWDKKQINKVPTLESDVNTLKSSVSGMPKEVTFHTEAALINWISVDGEHIVTLAKGNSANPIPDSEDSTRRYRVIVGREFDGTNFTGRRFQMPIHIATGRTFYRCGNVALGGSFNGLAWTEFETE